MGKERNGWKRVPSGIEARAPATYRRRRKKNDETRVTERELELELKLISKRQRGWKRFLSAGVSISRSVEARRMSVSCWRG